MWSGRTIVGTGRARERFSEGLLSLFAGMARSHDQARSTVGWALRVLLSDPMVENPCPGCSRALDNAPDLLDRLG